MYIKSEAKEKMQTKIIENQYGIVDNNLENDDLNILENSLDDLKLIYKVNTDYRNCSFYELELLDGLINEFQTEKPK